MIGSARNKNRYELALDAAIQKLYPIYKDYNDFIKHLNKLDTEEAHRRTNKIHTETGKLFAMGFAEWKEKNRWESISIKEGVEYYMCALSPPILKTIEQLLTLYNQSV